MTPIDTARVLVEALPYIRQFAGKSVVVKLGGAAIDRDSDLALAQDVLLLRSVGCAACWCTAAGRRSTRCFAGSARRRSSGTGFE